MHSPSGEQAIASCPTGYEAILVKTATSVPFPKGIACAALRSGQALLMLGFYIKI